MLREFLQANQQFTLPNKSRHWGTSSPQIWQFWFLLFRSRISRNHSRQVQPFLLENGNGEFPEIFLCAGHHEDKISIVNKTRVEREETAGSHLGWTSTAHKNYITCATSHKPCGIPNHSKKAGCSAGCWFMDSSGNCHICPEKCKWYMHVNQT